MNTQRRIGSANMDRILRKILDEGWVFYRRGPLFSFHFQDAIVIVFLVSSLYCSSTLTLDLINDQGDGCISTNL